LLQQQSEFLKSSVDPKRRMARAETGQEMVNKYALVTPDAQAMRHENTQTRLSARQDLMWRQRFFYWLKLMRKARTDIMYQASQRIVGEFVKTLKRSTTLMKNLGQLWDEDNDDDHDNGRPPF
jgi:hypothetical protein